MAAGTHLQTLSTALCSQTLVLMLHTMTADMFLHAGRQQTAQVTGKQDIPCDVGRVPGASLTDALTAWTQDFGLLTPSWYRLHVLQDKPP
jgi:hypothetical protein